MKLIKIFTQRQFITEPTSPFYNELEEDQPQVIRKTTFRKTTLVHPVTIQEQPQYDRHPL